MLGDRSVLSEWHVHPLGSTRTLQRVSSCEVLKWSHLAWCLWWVACHLVIWWDGGDEMIIYKVDLWGGTRWTEWSDPTKWRGILWDFGCSRNGSDDPWWGYSQNGSGDPSKWSREVVRHFTRPRLLTKWIEWPVSCNRDGFRVLKVFYNNPYLDNDNMIHGKFLFIILLLTRSSNYNVTQCTLKDTRLRWLKLLISNVVVHWKLQLVLSDIKLLSQRTQLFYEQDKHSMVTEAK